MYLAHQVWLADAHTVFGTFARRLEERTEESGGA